jgi:hypothetical protein
MKTSKYLPSKQNIKHNFNTCYNIRDLKETEEVGDQKSAGGDPL